MSLSLPGYQLMSPMAKIPGRLDSKVAVSTRMYSPSFIAMPQSATGPSFMVSPKNGSSASQAMLKLEPSLRFTIARARADASVNKMMALASALAFQRRNLTEHEVDPALGRQRHHLVDA